MDERVIQNALGKISQVAQQIKQSAYNVFSPQPQPLRQPEGNMVATKWGNIPFKGPDSGTVLASNTAPTPQPTVMPSPTPAPHTGDGFIFDYNQLPRDQYYAQNGPRPNFQPQQPPPQIGSIIREVFPNEATKAAGFAVTENSQFAPNREDAINYDKAGREVSRDRGLFQINNNTLNTEMRNNGEKLRSMGINSYEDMYDAKKNALFAKHLYDAYGAGRWFGWQDTGYDLKGGWFSAPLRGLYAEYKKTMSPEKALKKAREELEKEKKKK